MDEQNLVLHDSYAKREHTHPTYFIYLFFLLRIRILTSIDVYARALHCKSRVYDEQFALAKQ